MSEEKNDSKTPAPDTKDQVALEMMKFIAVTTGYGKGTGSSTGFGGKSATKTPEEYADALLDLFKKCREVVKS